MWHRTQLAAALIALSLAVPAGAQAPTKAPADGDDGPLYSLGAGPMTRAEIDAIPVVELTRAYIPEAIDLSPRFPVAGDQGDVGACVSWAAGYAARSYYTLLSSGSTANQTGNLVSPAYLHNRLTAGTGQCKEGGASIRVALDILKSHGALSLADYPAVNMCTATPATAGVPERNKINGYRTVGKPNWTDGSGPTRTGLKRESLDLMRLKLADGHPVIVGMLVGKRLMRLRGDDVYRGSIHQSGEIGAKGTGRHAMVVTGYDDRRQAFRLLNSWGTKWADNGYGWIDYETMLSDAIVGEVMEPEQSPTRPVPDRPTLRPAEHPESRQFECAQLDRSKNANAQMVLSGFVSRARDWPAVNALALTESLVNDVALRPWPICEAMLTLRHPLLVASRPSIELIGGARDLKVGETFAFQVKAPDVPSFLYLFYLEDDGTVVNLAPRYGPLRAQTQPGAAPMIFGDGRDGRQTFRVTPLKSVDAQGRPRAKGDPERGHEAVIAIAARAPIEELEDLEQSNSRIYRVDARARASTGPPDRLLLSVLKDIIFKRAEPGLLPREISADILHLKIID